MLRLSSEQDPEAVHGFRTATRRLQILLEQVVASPDRNQKKLLKALNRIRRRAGAVRDVDAQLSALRSLRVPLEPRRKTQLMHQLIELRVQHEKRLHKLLKKTEIQEVHKRLKKASRALDSDTSRDPLQVARKILNSVRVPENGLNDDALHRYRIAVKRARYAAEFAAKSAEADQLIVELKHLQDALGQWHDWLTLTQTAAQYLGEVSQSSLVAALHNLTRGKFRHAVEALAESPGLLPGDKKFLPSAVLPSSNPKRPASPRDVQTAA